MSITKPPVLPPWADTGDKTQPTNVEIEGGWPNSAIPPSRQRFNWILNFCANAVRYFSRRGVADWDAAETYLLNDRVIGDDGFTYKCIQTTNLNHIPSSSPAWWQLWGDNLASNFSLGTNGYVKFPAWLAGGLVIQWGTVTGVGDLGASPIPVGVTFPIVFPTAAYAIFPSLSMSNGYNVMVCVNNLTTSAANFVVLEQSALVQTGMAVSWFAVGK